MAMSITCTLCKQKAPLYKCPVCKTTAHVDKTTGQVVIHLPSPKIPKDIKARTLPLSLKFPSHPDCELAKPVNMIDLTKLEKVKVEG